MDPVKKVSLDNLYLDPNNYRLRSHPKYSHVNHNALIKPATQKKTMTIIAGKGNRGVRDLVESFKSNGLLKVDNILVKKIDKENYIVVEGNRRIAALKILKNELDEGYEIGNLGKKIFASVDKGGGIEVVDYDYKKDTEYLILMGLRHVSGNKKWDKYNQAKLVFELEQKKEYNLSEISKRIGIDTSTCERYIKGYHVVEEYLEYVKNKDCGEDFDPYDKFMIFVELLNHNKLREWVGWDDTMKSFKNKKNKERFFAWVTPRIELDEDEDEQEVLPSIIVNHKQVRELPEIIDKPASLDYMEQEGSFEKALHEDPEYSHSKFSMIIKDIEKKIKKINMGTSLSIKSDDRIVLKNIQKIIEKLLG